MKSSSNVFDCNMPSEKAFSFWSNATLCIYQNTKMKTKMWITSGPKRWKWPAIFCQVLLKKLFLLFDDLEAKRLKLKIHAKTLHQRQCNHNISKKELHILVLSWISIISLRKAKKFSSKTTLKKCHLKQWKIS